MKKLLVLVGLTAVAALYPYPAAFVEREYSSSVYPFLQSCVTLVSNALPIALLDLIVGVLLIAGAIGFRRVARRHGTRRAASRAVVWTVSSAAVVYLLFLATWGLNYRRVPLAAKMDFERGRISEGAAVRLAALAIERLNAGHAAAHRVPHSTDALVDAFHSTQALLGVGRSVTPGRPKRSLVQWYFRQAAINGMTVPVTLEVILNPDLLPVERPSTLAHEWAHLAGYAVEAEANFLAWLVCVRSDDPLAQYSGWLDAYGLAVSSLPRALRSSLPPLAEGPRQDLRAMAARYQRSSPRVREAARDVYDSYLKANRVEEGIASYGLALQLMLGTEFEPGWRPKITRDR